MGRQNPVAYYHTDLLQAYNLAANTTDDLDCAFLENAVTAWIRSTGSVPSSHRFTDEYDDTAFLVWGQLLPVRCDWQRDDGVITTCPTNDNPEDDLPDRLCDVWDTSKPHDVDGASTQLFADEFDLRVGGFRHFVRNTTAPADFGNGTTDEHFYVDVIFNGGHYISLVYVPRHYL
jgi:hypothetical protein